MDKGDDSRSELARAVVRICPACCTVNPAGPSAACPHVQLVRFDGLSPGLAALLAEVAAARRAYNELNARLRNMVLDAVREGAAEVETAHKPRRPEAGEAPDAARAGGPGPARSGTDAPSAERGRPPAKRRRTGAPPVDPRQLTLLAFSPPKGDA